MTSAPRLAAPLAFALIAALYLGLGLVVLTADAIYSGDIGVKFVQARALAAHRFTSLDLPYPGQFFDPERVFFALRPPFVITAGKETQAIFPPVSAVVQALAVAAAGVRGMMAVTIVAALATLWAAGRMSAPELRAVTLLALGLGGPLWFFAVNGWEHAPAVACGAIAFAVAMRGGDPRRAAIAGAVLGFGVTQRDEVMLLAPGLLLLLWMQSRTWPPLVAAAAAVALMVFAAGAMDVWWFGRPPAAHLRHAVHLVRGAWLGNEPGIDVPSLKPFTLADRYATVIQYWLLGYGNDRMIEIFTAGFAVALLLWRTVRTHAAILVWLGGMLALAAIDLANLVSAPKFLAGMLRVSPYFVFAFLPPPRGGPRWPRTRVALVLTAVIYVALAFGGVDTTGGKALGPRLLLPIFPILAVASIAAIADYLLAPGRMNRAIGVAGVTLLAMALTLHAAGAIPAYVARNRDDGSAMMAVRASPERIVVADDIFTAQLLMPLYFRKVIFVADGPPLARDLASRLEAARLAPVLLVSRGEPGIGLSPLRLGQVEHKGRFVIQHWTR